jgi:hypothetical protein
MDFTIGFFLRNDRIAARCHARCARLLSNTVRYTELAADRFEEFGEIEGASRQLVELPECATMPVLAEALDAREPRADARAPMSALLSKSDRIDASQQKGATCPIATF